MSYQWFKSFLTIQYILVVQIISGDLNHIIGLDKFRKSRTIVYQDLLFQSRSFWWYRPFWTIQIISVAVLTIRIILLKSSWFYWFRSYQEIQILLGTSHFWESGSPHWLGWSDRFTDVDNLRKSRPIYQSRSFPEIGGSDHIQKSRTICWIRPFPKSRSF